MAARSRKSTGGMLASVRKTVSGRHNAGFVDKATMREFDALCLTTFEQLSPDEIHALRKREQVYQPVTAHAYGHFRLALDVQNTNKPGRLYRPAFKIVNFCIRLQETRLQSKPTKSNIAHSPRE